MRLLSSILFLSYPLSIHSQTNETNTTIQATCGCKNVDNSFIVTRLWNIVGEGWTDQNVIDEFNSGFAPIVTQMEGFQQYTAAKTGNESTVLFFNIFQTPADALNAQAAAGDFVSEGVLNGNILPNQFTESQIAFHYASDECFDKPNGESHLSTRLWKLRVEATISIDEVADVFVEGFAPIISQADGFLEYGGAPVTFTNYIFFYNFFEDRERGLQANKLAAEFVLSGDLNNQIERIVFTEGMVGFDYACAIPSTSAEIAESDDTNTDEDADDTSEEEEADTSTSDTNSMFSTLASAFSLGVVAFILCATA